MGLEDSRLVKLYKKWDMYGKTLTLTFDGEDTHYTIIGATITLMIVMFMLIYGIFQLETMFKKERTTINLKSTYTDLTRDYANVSLNDYGFDFALQLSLYGNPVYDESYFTYEVENVISWWAEDENGEVKRYKISHDLEMDRCDYYNAPPAEVERLGIDESFYCPRNKDYVIGGTFTAPIYSYLYIKLLKCENTTSSQHCRSDEEIDQYLDQTQLSLYYNNFYF